MTDRQTRKVKIRVAKAERSRTNYRLPVAFFNYRLPIYHVKHACAHARRVFDLSRWLYQRQRRTSASRPAPVQWTGRGRGGGHSRTQPWLLRKFSLFGDMFTFVVLWVLKLNLFRYYFRWFQFPVFSLESIHIIMIYCWMLKKVS